MKTKYLSLFSMLVAGALACGDDDGGSGAGPDAAPRPDGAPAEPAVCGVDLNFGSGSAGALVLFTAPNGTHLGNTFTDVDGLASGPCVPGTAITVDLSTTSSGGFGVQRDVQLFTFAGVMPGQTIPFPYADYEGNFSASVDTQLGAAPGPSTDGYRVAFGCSNTSVAAPPTGVELNVSQFCRDAEGEIDVFAYGRDTGDVITHYATALDVPTIDEQTTDLTLDTWTNYSSALNVTVDLSNPAPGTDYLEVEARQGRRNLDFFEPNVTHPPANLPLTQGFSGMPDTFAEHLDVYSYAEFDGFGGVSVRGGGPPSIDGQYSFTQMFARGPIGTRARTADFSEHLPRVSGVLAQVVNGVAQVQWFADGSMVEAGADGVAVALNIYNPNSGYGGFWLIVAPASDGGSFPVPSLPAELVDLAGWTFDPFGVSFFDYSWLNYGEVLSGGVEPEGLFYGHPNGVPNAPDLTRTARSSTFEFEYDFD